MQIKHLCEKDLVGQTIKSVKLVDGHIEILTDIGIGITARAEYTYGFSKTQQEPFVDNWLQEVEDFHAGKGK